MLSRVGLSLLCLKGMKMGEESSLSEPYTNDSYITTADWFAFLLAVDWSVFTERFYGYK